MDSTAFQDGTHTHTFEDTRDFMDEVFWARMYAGFHYYHSLEDGQRLGETVARAILRNHFGPQQGITELRREEAGIRRTGGFLRAPLCNRMSSPGY